VILAGVLLIAVYNNVQINILGNSYSSFMGYSLFEVQTGSMEPEIHQGSLVYVKTYKTKDDIYDNIDVGTDITYSTNNKIFVTHRVISLSEENGTLQTQGIIDNAAIEDISYTQVVGKVVFVIPLLGYVILLLKSWYIWAILILTVVIVFIFKLLLKELRKK
jgi:signal peptidase I